MDLTNEKHYARFEREMLSSAAHSTIAAAGGGGDAAPVGMTKGQLYKYYQAQTLWDEYMAESAAKYMDSHPDSRLVVLAGASHVARSSCGMKARLAESSSCTKASSGARANRASLL